MLFLHDYFNKLLEKSIVVFYLYLPIDFVPCLGWMERSPVIDFITFTQLPKILTCTKIRAKETDKGFI